MAVKIKRIKGGKAKRKYNIVLDNIDPWYQKVLFENPLIKEYLKTDDQFVQILFKMAEMERAHKVKNKVYYNPYLEEITAFEDIEIHSNLIDWNCAICNTEIQSNIANFKIDNFTCNKCKNAHNSTNKRIDPRIVDSSFEFHKFCRNQLIKDQKKFLKYIKHFEMGYTRGQQ
jgi:hypothetical protein